MIRILIAEDQEFFMERTKKIVSAVFNRSRLAFQILEATNFASARVIIRTKNEEKAIDIFICDHYMPAFSDSHHLHGVGSELYFEVRAIWRMIYEGAVAEPYFIHHLSDACFERYDGCAEDKKFFHIEKSSNFNILGVILLQIIKKEGWDVRGKPHKEIK